MFTLCARRWHELIVSHLTDQPLGTAQHTWLEVETSVYPVDCYLIFFYQWTKSRKAFAVVCTEKEEKLMFLKFALASNCNLLWQPIYSCKPLRLVCSLRRHFWVYITLYLPCLAFCTQSCTSEHTLCVLRSCVVDTNKLRCIVAVHRNIRAVDTYITPRLCSCSKSAVFTTTKHRSTLVLVTDPMLAAWQSTPYFNTMNKTPETLPGTNLQENKLHWTSRLYVQRRLFTRV